MWSWCRIARNHGNTHAAYPNLDASTWFFLVFMTTMELETWELLFRNPFFLYLRMDELNTGESKDEKVLKK